MTRFAFRWDAIFLITIIFLLPIFFFKLGQSSLDNWDEAWYGAIAKNIVRSGDLIHLSWNGAPFTDHPPAGFWLMAIPLKLFGVSEFWVRFTSAICGVLSLVSLYLLGKVLVNPLVGYVSSVALSSATWFLYRARSGNLDVILTFFFLLTLLLGIKSKDNKKLLLPFIFSLGILLLIKTAVPFTIIPALVIVFWGIKFKRVEWILMLLLLTCLIGGYFGYMILTSPGFLAHYLNIGLPGVHPSGFNSDNLFLMKKYLHNGIGKWFWPGIFSIGVGLFLGKKSFLILSIFFLTFFTPFLFSTKGHIWHLIPLYPFMILSFFSVFYLVLNRLLKNKVLVNMIIIFVAFYISFIQIRTSWLQFINIPAYISDEAILSREAGKYTETFYIDGDFGPTAHFYSEKVVKKIANEELREIFNKDKSFVLITGQWRLDKELILASKYRTLKKDRDRMLILKV